MVYTYDKIFLFDLDGTLTEPKRTIHPDHWEFWKELSKNHTLGLVGSSSINNIIKQMNVSEEELTSTFAYVFSENGLDGRINGLPIPKQSLLKFLGEEKYENLVNFVLKMFSEIKLPKKRSNFIDLRHGMVNISPIGRNCTYQDREEFMEYDKKHNIRNMIVNRLREEFQEYGLDYALGGQISIDIFPIGWDKRYCLNYLGNRFSQIYFFGDKTFPGGNDYGIYNDDRTIGHTVTGPIDTIVQVQKIVKSFYTI
uniref:Phosphomannomutase n=1 Tax=Parastrongyloides trichosuri TaxID=131310 RepID=A0A0N4Z937_PARTI